MDTKMKQFGAISLVVMLVCVVGAVQGIRCPRGWEKIGCNNEWKCGLPMDQFDSDKACIKRGGVPGVTICVSRLRRKIKETYGRYCMKDALNGNIKFARKTKN